MVDVLGPAPEPRTLAETLREEGRALLERGEFAASLAAYDRALLSARATEDETFVDWIYACRAAAAAEAGSADDELVQLKRILLRAADTETAFRCAYTGARIYEIRRDYKKALFYSRIARERAELLGEARLLGATRNQQGSLLMADSRFEEAAEAFQEALASADGSAAEGTFAAQWKDNLGYCLLNLERVDEGLKLVTEAFDHFEELGLTALTVYPLLDLCFGYLKLDRFAEARTFGELGLERAVEGEEAAVEKNFLYLLGETCHLAGDQESAEDYFDRLASHYPEFKNLRAYLEVFDFRNVINLRA